jgi:hypothetical protein
MGFDCSSSGKASVACLIGQSETLPHISSIASLLNWYVEGVQASRWDLDGTYLGSDH